jgi:hypothetical protein
MRVIGVVGVIAVTAGCDSAPRLTFPSPLPIASSPAPSPSPSPNTREPGPVRTSATTITPGEVTAGTIMATDLACFPNWDSTGRCRQYEMTPTTDGTLLGTLRLTGPSRGVYDTELFLLAPDGTWVWAPESWPERRVSMQVRGGESYRLVVLGYGPFPERFDLVAVVEP